MLTRYTLVALALLLAAAVPARAQHDDAIAAVEGYFHGASARYGAGANDLAEFVVTDAYTSRRSGATYVYLRQALNGIPVFNAPAQAAVTSDGAIMAPHARFVSDLAARANAPQPAMMAEAAAAEAVRYLQGATPRPHTTPTLSDAPDEIAPDLTAPYPAEHFVPDLEHTRLVYFATEAGPVRLAWDLMVATRDGLHVFSLRVDAETGSVLDVHDLVDHDTWPQPDAAEAVVDLAPRAAAPASMAAAMGGNYNVFALPAESPNHGPQVMVANPADATASPEGWHSTGGTSYTITRGNNVYAYEDRDNNNAPGFSPDGGGGLVFDFPFDPAEQPEDYQDLAVTSAFYWTNIVHDIMYQYGFDEAAGNFQTNNFGNGGAGNDHVLAEAQDGSGVDNANFFTPSDGQNGRMQMYEWSPGFFLEVEAPETIAGTYPSGTQVAGDGTPDWGDTDGYSITAEVVLVESSEEQPLGCEPPTNGAEIAGKIAIVQRGGCDFAQKVWNAQEAGAIGVIVHNCIAVEDGCTGTNPGETILNMSADPSTYPHAADVTIPAQFVARSTGILFRNNLPGVTVTMEESTIFRDSDLDAGVITHELSHGTSNRLTGGPSNVGCLGNTEQMGEGWGDWYGLMFTQKTGDTAGQPRGVGTYLSFEGIDGIGIRPAPYSTDPAINDYTYSDLPAAIVPHGVGFVWATMLWEMTWELIGQYGYDDAVYDAAGTAGNQIALNLVTEGMKLQPCSPGFVDGRDAILEADTLLYGGQYSDQIWMAFARRGLGVNASQGSSNSITDGVADFSLPTGVANEEQAAALPEGFRLTTAYPNPFSSQAQFTLEVAEAQRVKVEVFDALGRRVAILHDGDLVPGAARAFVVDGRNLASGTYLVRAVGEAFTATQQVTVLK